MGKARLLVGETRARVPERKALYHEHNNITIEENRSLEWRRNNKNREFRLLLARRARVRWVSSSCLLPLFLLSPSLFFLLLSFCPHLSATAEGGARTIQSSVFHTHQVTGRRVRFCWSKQIETKCPTKKRSPV